MTPGKQLPPNPTRAAIESGGIREDQRYEFKTEVDLGRDQAKSDLVDDVVAFLNAGPGHIVVGVMEKRGAFVRFSPLRGDPDAEARRFVQILQDNIDPKPLDLDATAIDLDGGFIMWIRIGEHRRQPYQNRINGAFLKRTGAKNTPLPRSEVEARFVDEDRYRRDARDLMVREDARTAARGVLAAPEPTLHLAIVPRERYARFPPRLRRSFEPPNGLGLKTAPTYHERRAGIFHGCQGGSDDVAPDRGGHDARFFVGDDWSVYTQVAWPIRVTDGEDRLDLPGFEAGLTAFLKAIDVFLTAEGVYGPFCVDVAVRGLDHRRTAFFFPASSAIELGNPVMIDRLGDAGLAAYIYETVQRGSRYG